MNVGFDYSIVPSDIRGNFLTIAFVPAELFDAYCALQTPLESDYDHTWNTMSLPGGGHACDCTESECHAAKKPVQRIEMVVTDESMVGEYQYDIGASVTPPSVRLKRVR